MFGFLLFLNRFRLNAEQEAYIHEEAAKRMGSIWWIPIDRFTNQVLF